MRHLLVLALTLVVLSALVSACGSDCPGGGQSGNCNMSNTQPDPAMDVTQLSVKSGCEYVGPTFCTGDPGITCASGGGERARFGYAVIVDKAGWDKLAAQWSDPTACAPAGLPTDWTDTFLVVSSLHATAATDSSVTHTLHRLADGKPLIKLDYSVTYQESCDCATDAARLLVVKGQKPPSVCLKVASTCQ